MLTSTFLFFCFLMSIAMSETVVCKKSSSCKCTVDEDCILQCIGKDYCKDEKLTCRSGYDCTIVCDGESACSGNTEIDAEDAIDVDVTCEEKDSCKGNTELLCGTGDCDLNCDGEKSCEDMTVDKGSSTSFTCSGYCVKLRVISVYLREFFVATNNKFGAAEHWQSMQWMIVVMVVVFAVLMWRHYTQKKMMKQVQDISLTRAVPYQYDACSTA